MQLQIQLQHFCLGLYHPMPTLRFSLNFQLSIDFFLASPDNNDPAGGAPTLAGEGASRTAVSLKPTGPIKDAGKSGLSNGLSRQCQTNSLVGQIVDGVVPPLQTISHDFSNDIHQILWSQMQGFVDDLKWPPSHEFIAHETLDFETMTFPAF